MCASKIGSCAAAGVAPSTTAATSAASILGIMAAMVALAHRAAYSAATTRLTRGDAMGDWSRRQALRVLGSAAALVAGRTSAWAQASDAIVAGRPLVRYPQKTDLILLTSRPPQLETPMKWFDRAITPNEAFFVRYHVFPIPTRVDLATWRLRVGGL